MTDKTLGEYKRTTPDPDETTGEALARLQAELTRLLDDADAELRDEADGGVTAALIEKEAEQKPTAAEAEADRGFMEAAADDWHSAAVQASGEALAAAARARRAENALETLREQYGTAVRERDEWEANAEAAEDRAEKAERERDEALAGVRVLARENIACHERVAKPVAEPRPFTPDDVTGEMAAQAMLVLARHGYRPGHTITHEALTAALTVLTRPDVADDA